jgi:hypothetical protein
MLDPTFFKTTTPTFTWNVGQHFLKMFPKKLAFFSLASTFLHRRPASTMARGARRQPQVRKGRDGGGGGVVVVVVVKLTDRRQGSGWRDHVGQGRQWPVSGGGTKGV